MPTFKKRKNKRNPTGGHKKNLMLPAIGEIPEESNESPDPSKS